MEEIRERQLLGLDPKIGQVEEEFIGIEAGIRVDPGMESRTKPPEESVSNGSDSGPGRSRAPRLFIKEMVMRNFKSYAGEQRVGPFHKVRVSSLLSICLVAEKVWEKGKKLEEKESEVWVVALDI